MEHLLIYSTASRALALKNAIRDLELSTQFLELYDGYHHLVHVQVSASGPGLPTLWGCEIEKFQIIYTHFSVCGRAGYNHITHTITIFTQICSHKHSHTLFTHLLFIISQSFHVSLYLSLSLSPSLFLTLFFSLSLSIYLSIYLSISLRCKYLNIYIHLALLFHQYLSLLPFSR